jgi:hypothetical protein
MLHSRWPQATVVDSAEVVGPGGTLVAGGPLFVVSPIDWMGPDDARLEVARYGMHWSWGEQYFVWLHRSSPGWHVARVEIGWQN